MKLVTDLDEIKRLSRQKEEENWGFRSFLKSGSITSKKIDMVARKLYKRIAAKIDCTKCGSCCQVMDVKLDENSIKRLAKRLKISEEECVRQHLTKNREDKYIFAKMPCVFLEGTQCSLYSSRPDYCQSYPCIQNKSIVPRLINIIKNTSVCPIVYNFYEALKSEIWSMNDGFDDLDEDDYL